MNIPHPKDELLLAPTSLASPVTFTIHNSSLFTDLSAIHALEKICFGRDAWSYIDLIAMFFTPGIVRLNAVADDRIVGFVVGDPNQWERAGWVATICVHPDYRRRGMGEALLAKCEESLRQSKVKLTVRASNAAAIALYLKQGYEQVGLWERYYAGGEDGVVMEKIRRQ